MQLVEAITKEKRVAKRSAKPCRRAKQNILMTLFVVVAFLCVKSDNMCNWLRNRNTCMYLYTHTHQYIYKYIEKERGCGHRSPDGAGDDGGYAQRTKKEKRGREVAGKMACGIEDGQR